eukprot:CAMPEP_0185793694 /NCGR_PEP_ID=MMETSP1174-20130828/159614_1 /TAXON_ID=35687 /ORGANISM="Dictyocha speculum, Strain CCMP1381" /LENGTH=528 /DNA_ID=CAMNT_0028488865 /DNA_START=754 /DNA_END=2340 /DNA_ORIENTATION=+
MRAHRSIEHSNKNISVEFLRRPLICLDSQLFQSFHDWHNFKSELTLIQCAVSVSVMCLIDCSEHGSLMRLIHLDYAVSRYQESLRKGKQNDSETKNSEASLSRLLEHTCGSIMASSIGLIRSDLEVDDVLMSSDQPDLDALIKSMRPEFMGKHEHEALEALQMRLLGRQQAVRAHFGGDELWNHIIASNSNNSSNNNNNRSYALEERYKVEAEDANVLDRVYAFFDDSTEGDSAPLSPPPEVPEDTDESLVVMTSQKKDTARRHKRHRGKRGKMASFRVGDVVSVKQKSRRTKWTEDEEKTGGKNDGAKSVAVGDVGRLSVVESRSGVDQSKWRAVVVFDRVEGLAVQWRCRLGDVERWTPNRNRSEQGEGLFNTPQWETVYDYNDQTSTEDSRALTCRPAPELPTTAQSYSEGAIELASQTASRLDDKLEALSFMSSLKTASSTPALMGCETNTAAQSGRNDVVTRQSSAFESLSFKQIRKFHRLAHSSDRKRESRVHAYDPRVHSSDRIMRGSSYEVTVDDVVSHV